jgi:hypothetical protein
MTQANRDPRVPDPKIVASKRAIQTLVKAEDGVGKQPKKKDVDAAMAQLTGGAAA